MLPDCYPDYLLCERNLQYAIKPKTSLISLGVPQSYPFLGFKIAVTGYFSEDWPHDKFQFFIEKGGGIFAFEIDRDVTHLICTTYDYLHNAVKGTPMLLIATVYRGFRSTDNVLVPVQEAKKWKEIKIFTRQWVEHSANPPPKGMGQFEEYSHHCIVMESIMRHKMKEQARQRHQRKARRYGKNAAKKVVKAIKAAGKASYKAAGKSSDY
ncbi:MAG: hypothetical protein MMC33_001419 [Icmadophila ericetorum]|nr:hypothetical protein [Icmadophila ericetorum]